MNRVLTILLLLSIIGVTSAQFGQSSLPSISWGTVDSGTMCNAPQGGMVVLATEGDLQRWWSRTIGKPAATAPKSIKWGFEKAIAIHLGQRPTAGYALSVQGIDRIGPTRARIRVLESRPRQGAMTAQVITSPWVLIRVANSPVDFELSVGAREGQWIGGMEILQTGPQGCNCRCDCGSCRCH